MSLGGVEQTATEKDISKDFASPGLLCVSPESVCELEPLLVRVDLFGGRIVDETLYVAEGTLRFAKECGNE